MTDAPSCPATGRPMVRDVRPLIVSYQGRSLTVDMPGWYCDESGETIHTRDDMNVSDRALITLKAEAKNLATPDEIRRIRTDLRLSQAEASRLVGGGKHSFQKYESGEVLASSVLTFAIRMLARHPEDLDGLRKEEAQKIAAEERAGA